MLLIGDIHIINKKKDRILSSIREYIFSHEDDSVLFLGDYVYHFNYDRKALMGLFDLFVECFEKGKDVYVLAGNHDRLSGHFVYEEAQRAFSYVAGSSDHGSLHFITEPEFHTIQGQECLFFPYHIPDQSIQIDKSFHALAESSHTKEQWSGRANSLITSLIENWDTHKKSETLWIFHHRYMIGTSFPGQFARFSYKSPGLSDHLFDREDIKLCSGHLHQPFSYKNYLCVGSVRSTSPLEINQTKCLFQLEPKTQILHATPVHVNPYISVEVIQGSIVDRELITNTIQQNLELTTELLGSGDFNFHMKEALTEVDLKYCTLTLQADARYEQVHELIAEDFSHEFYDLRIKQSSRSLPQMVDLLQTKSQELDTRISSWKSLLGSYIQQKHGKQAQHYFDELRALDINLE